MQPIVLHTFLSIKNGLLLILDMLGNKRQLQSRRHCSNLSWMLPRRHLQHAFEEVIRRGRQVRPAVEGQLECNNHASSSATYVQQSRILQKAATPGDLSSS
jgi:hypothetical protein